MTSVALSELRILWLQVLNLPAVSSPPPATRLQLSWAPPAEDDSNRILAGEPELPDFGFQFATRVHACLGSGRLRLLGKRGKRAFLRRLRDFGVIRAAVEVLDRRRRGDDETEAWPAELQAVNAAIELHEDPAMRHRLQALLIARESTPAAVAEALGIDRAALAAFADLFVNVIDRRDEPFVLPVLAARLASGRDFRGGQPPTPTELKHLAAAPDLTVREMLAIMGFPGDGETGDPSAAATASMRLIEWNRRLLLGCGMAPTSAPARSLAAALKHARRGLDLLEKAYPKKGMYAEAARQVLAPDREVIERAIELRRTSKARPGENPSGPDAVRVAERTPTTDAAEQAGTDGRESAASEAPATCPPHSAPLTLARIRALLPLWQEPPTPPPTRLVLSWKTAPAHPTGRQTAAIAERPDFGFEFARQMAGRDAVESIPADPAFYWIRVAARYLQGGKVADLQGGEPDPDLAVVERAMQIHGSPECRALLQALLFAGRADHEDVARGLGLEPRLLDAYATLFFNVIARCNDRAHIARIADQLSAGRDPASGEPIPPEFVEMSRAAVQLSVAQLVQLIGGWAGGSADDGSRAKDLMRNLLDLAERGLICTDGLDLKDLVETMNIAEGFANEAFENRGSLGIYATAARQILMRDSEIVERQIERRMELRRQQQQQEHAAAVHNTSNSND